MLGTNPTNPNYLSIDPRSIPFWVVSVAPFWFCASRWTIPTVVFPTSEKFQSPSHGRMKSSSSKRVIVVIVELSSPDMSTPPHSTRLHVSTYTTPHPRTSSTWIRPGRASSTRYMCVVVDSFYGPTDYGVHGTNSTSELPVASST